MFGLFKRNHAANVAPVEQNQYHSKYGGLWTDRLDAMDVLEQKIASGELPESKREQLTFWIKNGFMILPGAVSEDKVDALKADIAKAWEVKDARYKIQTGHSDYITLPEADQFQPLYKLLDFYTYSKAAREVQFAPDIKEFLNTIFEDEVLAFQNLTFHVGSTQRIHQDTAYVVTEQPLKLAASWVALEDVTAGSGELQYIPGSHRYPDYPFNDRHKHWDPEKDGNEIHGKFLDWLVEKADELGLEVQNFLPKKGDALIWSADLAHGGAPITDEEATRQSYVTHYCPRSISPVYFKFTPERSEVKEVMPGCHIASLHYDIKDALAN